MKERLLTCIPLGRLAPSKNRKKIDKQRRTTHTKIQKHSSETQFKKLCNLHHNSFSSKAAQKIVAPILWAGLIN